MVTGLKNLVLLRKNQIKTASKILAQAFQDDPTTFSAYSNKRDQKTKMPYTYEFLLRYYDRYADIYTTSENLEGIAVWQRYDNEKDNISLRKVILSGAIWPALKIGVRIPSILKPFFDNEQKKLIPYPYWYLAIIGVALEYQGKGYASKLIRGMLPRIDAECMTCYLDTAEEKNIALYQHFGFKVINESVVPGTTIRLWAMLRDGKRSE